MTLDVDVAVVGGGINGLGVARDLAMRGFSVYLAEKRDFGTGATGNSSGMIHGGLRYLLSDPQVTRDSCRDSGYIQNISKNLCFRIPFLLPVYDSRAFAKTYLMLTEVFFEAYDEHQSLKHGRPHARLSRDETLAIEPGINGDALLGAVTTDEWGVDAMRLAALNALDARAHGAILENYAEVTGLLREGGEVRGVEVARRGERRQVRASVVLNCTGAWNATFAKKLGASVPVRPGKGIHLIFDARISDYAIVTFAIDGRQVFLMPHQNESWFGTTDDDFFGDPDRLTPTADEVEYLLGACERLFPRIRDYRCFSTSVGLRPTVHSWGPNEDALSREHRILDHTAEGLGGLFSMIGGKLASYRMMAEELADTASSSLGGRAVGRSACRTHVAPLPGHDRLVDPQSLVDEFGIEGIAARRLVRRHGTGAAAILRAGASTPGGLSTVCACEPTLECEVRHVLQHEWIEHPTDLVRRCRVACGPCLGLRCAARVGQIYAEEKGGGQPVAVEAALALASEAARRAAPVVTPRLAMQLERVERALVENGGA